MLALLLALQMATTVFLVNIHPGMFKLADTGNKVGKILGISFLAQNDQTAPVSSETTPTEVAAPTETIAPTETTILDTPTSPPEPTVTSNQPTTPPQESKTPPSTNEPNQEKSQPTPEDTPTQAINEEQNLQINQNEPEEINSQNNDILQTDQSINNNQIDQQQINEAKKEEGQLEEAKTSDTKVNLLTQFATDKIKDIETSQELSNYSNVNFATQRLNNQISQAIETAKKAGDQKTAHNQLKALCDRLQTSLRMVQLSSPETLTQDLEIVQSKCLGVNQ